MLMLIVNEEGNLEQRWIPDTKTATVRILGEALKDETGSYCDSAWLAWKDDQPIYDPNLKAQAKQKEQDDIAARALKETARLTCLDNIRTLSKSETGLIKEISRAILGEFDGN